MARTVLRAPRPRTLLSGPKALSIPSVGCPLGSHRSVRSSEDRMTRLSLFNSPFLLGFDQFERALDRVAKGAGDGYPPYNIEQIGDNALRITLAVAGFTRDDLTVSLEDRQLTISGKQHTDETPRTYLHRGIAARQFQRSFLLAEG